MRLSVAPLSSSASFSAFLPPVYSETRAFIDLFVAMYTEFRAQARAIAVVLRPLENPFLLPSSLLSLRRHLGLRLIVGRRVRRVRRHR
jgi:hypothetical protein